MIQGIESIFKKQLFSLPTSEEIIEKIKVPQSDIQKITKILIEQQKIVRIEKDMFFHIIAVEQAREILISYINQHCGLESVKFKYFLNKTRKFPIPLLDYFDRINLTRRFGYTRYLRNPNL